MTNIIFKKLTIIWKLELMNSQSGSGLKTGVDIGQLLRALPVLLKSKNVFTFGHTWSLTLSLIMVGNGVPPLQPTLMMMLSMYMVVASVYIYNDVQDAPMDRENEIKRNRPIASGQVSSVTAQILVYLLAISGLSLAWSVNITSFGFMLAFFIIFYFYSHPAVKLKNRFLGKDFTLVIANPLICLAANYAISNEFSPLAFQCACLTALYILTQAPIAHEASDIVEDKKYGVKSISTMTSWEFKIRFMILGILLQMILVPLIQLQYGVNLILPVFSVASLSLILVTSYPLLKSYSYDKFTKANKIGFLHAFASPITFILIAIRLPLFF